MKVGIMELLKKKRTFTWAAKQNIHINIYMYDKYNILKATSELKKINLKLKLNI